MLSVLYNQRGPISKRKIIRCKKDPIDIISIAANGDLILYCYCILTFILLANNNNIATCAKRKVKYSKFKCSQGFSF